MTRLKLQVAIHLTLARETTEAGYEIRTSAKEGG